MSQSIEVDEIPKVQRAFRLGWCFTQIYQDPPLPNPGAESNDALPNHLPGPGELRAYDQGRLLVGQMQHDVTALNGAEDADIKRFAEVSDQGGTPETTRRLILNTYRNTRIRLGSDPRLGAALDLGQVLADIVLLPGSETYDASFGKFNSSRLASLYGWLDDLHTVLPRHAAHAVKGSLRRWESWVAEGVAADIREYSTQVLYHQGEIWRRILSGEILAEDLLTAESYRQAAIRLLGRLRSLTVGFLKRWWGLVLFLLLLVGVPVWAIVTYEPTDAIAIAALIATGAGALGISWKTVTSTLGKVSSKAEGPLWDAEVLQSIVVATTVIPSDPRVRATVLASPRGGDASRSLPTSVDLGVPPGETAPLAESEAT
jgi:hypothetical protein